MYREKVKSIKRPNGVRELDVLLNAVQYTFRYVGCENMYREKVKSIKRPNGVRELDVLLNAVQYTFRYVGCENTRAG